MNNHQPNIAQQQILDVPLLSHIFLEGPFACGKTTTALFWLERISLQTTIDERILILTPQRTLSEPYRVFTRDQDIHKGILPEITTLGGLSRKFVDRYWAEINRENDFSSRSSSPTFLNMETAQYFMEQICEPMRARGYFLEIRIDPPRLYSQILDTMNKAALVGYPLEETEMRLKNAWNGEPIREKHYEQSQECALAFRKFCHENNLLDFSLQVELFRKYMISSPSQMSDFFQPYRYLIADNIEEDVPVMHDLLISLTDRIPSMLCIKDENAGYRSFLGADSHSADRLKEVCSHQFRLDEPFQAAPDLHTFRIALTNCILRKDTHNFSSSAKKAFTLRTVGFYPDLINEVCSAVGNLVQEESVPPEQITILSPYLSDSLKFNLSQRFTSMEIPFQTSRPSRSLAEEPITQAVLTLAKAAHPQWGLPIQMEVYRHAIMTLFPQCDIVRASLLAHNSLQGENKIISFSTIPAFTRERITNSIGNSFDHLVSWLDAYKRSEPLPLDIFLSILFGEVLSQPGFVLHEDLDSTAIVARLIRSVRAFRTLFTTLADSQHRDIGNMFIDSLEKGMLPAAHYIPQKEEKALTISPAFTFLMKNRSVRYQFWLDIGDIGWWERLDQPLTHPHVLKRTWQIGQKWTDADEYMTNQESLSRTIGGLLDRCDEHVYLYAVGLNQAGINQSSPLLRALQLFLKRTAQEGEHA